MVLDAGCLVEFASPAELLKNEKSFFRALVEESADKDELYRVALAKAPSQIPIFLFSIHGYMRSAFGANFLFVFLQEQ
jgi:hypothetical protein